MVRVGKYHISSYNITCGILIVCSLPSPGLFSPEWSFGLILGLVIPFFVRFIRLKVQPNNPNAWYVMILIVPVILAIADLFLVKDWWPVRQGFVTGALISLIAMMVLDHVRSDEDEGTP